ncbi:MAG: hypothetical protein ABIZ81_13270 [Opitutaceae bacterium]
MILTVGRSALRASLSRADAGVWAVRSEAAVDDDHTLWHPELVLHLT